jgi:hypothetical protein
MDTRRRIKCICPVLHRFYRDSQVAAFPGVITALGDEAIVGVGVASHFNIILDHGRRVVVEP